MPLPVERLRDMEARFVEVERKLSDPEVAARPDELRSLGKEHSELRSVVDRWRDYNSALNALNEAKAMLAESTGEERAYIESEIDKEQRTLDRLEQELAAALIPKDPNDERDVIVEIRAGAGGDEAGLFAADLFRMYTRYAENKRFKTEVLNANETGVGGYKEVVFAVKGKGAYSRLKHEGGVHRVQRVPVTESSGRIHTSAAAVLVLPEAEEVDIEVDPKDIRVDVFRSSGPGGQSVNTTDSAVRITHVPTGEVVSVQDEKSQIQNREKAMRILRARLLQMEQEKQSQEQAAQRQSQVRTADRSERIRTYNFPENRVTDHRINYTVHRLTAILEGDLDELIDTLATHFQARQLSGSNA